MTYRTFFTVRVGKDSTVALTIDESVTFKDVSRQLTSELVAARLDNAPITTSTLTSVIPEATAAARQYLGMQAKARNDKLLLGPFKATTLHPPTHAQLLDAVPLSNGRKP